MVLHSIDRFSFLFVFFFFTKPRTRISVYPVSDDANLDENQKLPGWNYLEVVKR